MLKKTGMEAEMKKERDFLMFVLTAYEKLVCHRGEKAVWMDTPDDEWEVLENATEDVLTYYSKTAKGGKMQEHTLAFLRFAVDMYTGVDGAPTWTGTVEGDKLLADSILTRAGGINIHQPVRFDRSHKVHMDAALMVEDIQCLLSAIKTEDWVEVRLTANCLAEVVESCGYKKTDSGCKVTISPSSIVSSGKNTGVLCFEDGSDIPCAAWRPVSDAMENGCLQCPATCPFHTRQGGNCAPEDGRIKLYNNMIYSCKNNADAIYAAINESY